MSDIPYNIEFEFDDNLREVPQSPKDMRRAIDHLETRLIEESQDDYERMRLSGIVGSLYRILGDYEMAEEHINSAISSSNNLRDRRAQLLNLLRLAQIYQVRQQYALADRIFKQVIQTCEADNDNVELGHAYEYYGKCLFDQGDYEIALHMFEKALKLHEANQDAFLIDAIEHAIRITREKLAFH